MGDDVQRWSDDEWKLDDLHYIHVFSYFYDGPQRQESFVPIDGEEYQRWLETIADGQPAKRRKVSET